MFSFRKVYISIIAVLVICMAFGNVNSLATSLSGNNTNTPLVLTGAGTGNTTNNATNNATNNTANNVVTNNTTNNTANNATNNAVNKVTNSSSRNNTTNTTKSSLPYAGTNYNIVFVAIGLAVSAIYAYKKVSDYNV